MTADDPKFTAYALNALLTEEKEIIEPEVLADRELWSEAELTAAFAEKLKKAFTVEENARLSAAHWREIYAEAGIEEPPGIIPLEPELAKRRLPTWAIAAAAGVAIGAVVASLAITWNDIIPKFTTAPQPQPAEEPVDVAIPETPAVVATVPPKSETPSKQVAPFIPRPQAPPVVVNRALPVVVKAEPTNMQFDFIEPEDSIVEVQPLPDIQPMLADEPPAQPTRAPLFQPFRPFPRTVASTPAPAPAPIVVAANPPPKTTAAAPFVKKQSASLAAVPQNKKPSGTRSQTGNPRIASAEAAVSERLAPSPSPDIMNLDLSRFRTLDALTQVAIPEQTPTLSGFRMIGFGQSFALIENPQIKFTAVLNNAGLPIEVTPGNADVLYISPPYTVPANP